MLMASIVPSHFATTFTAPQPLVASTVFLASSPWICSICCCMRAACFMSLPMLDIILNGRGCLGSDFHDLALENLEGFLDQWIIFEIFLRGGGRGFFRLRSCLGGGELGRFTWCRGNW